MDCNLKVKLYLEQDNSKFMGIGVMWLLQAIEKEKSLRAAANSLGISYSKAYTMLDNLEKALEKPIVVRKKGGQDRAGATLTPFAKDFLALYDSFQQEAKLKIEKPFSDFQTKLTKLQQQYS